MNYVANEKQFGDGPSLASSLKVQEEVLTKLNIKINKGDLRLIDRLGELSGRSRSSILVQLISIILNDFLRTMFEEDKDTAAVMALYADAKIGLNYRSRGGWTEIIFGDPDSLEVEFYWSDERKRRKESSGFSLQHDELERRIEELEKKHRGRSEK